jgi:hypothetical protein
MLLNNGEKKRKETKEETKKGKTIKKYEVYSIPLPVGTTK